MPITVSLQPLACACHHRHPNIETYTATVSPLTAAKHATPTSPSPASIGTVKLHRLNKGTMEAVSRNTMWEESQAYDSSHLGAKLDKIENYLSNESFPFPEQSLIDSAKAILYIESVFLAPESRGRGMGLEAVKLVAGELGLPRETVVMLEAGQMMGVGTVMEAEDSDEKLTRYWGRLGFREWSDSDPAWLLLSLKDGFASDCRE